MSLSPPIMVQLLQRTFVVRSESLLYFGKQIPTFSVTVWCDISSSQQNGPFIFVGRLAAHNCNLINTTCCIFGNVIAFIFASLSMYSYCMFMYLLRASWHSSATLTEVFPCFFHSCKANARVSPAKIGHGPHSSKFLCCSMYCLFCIVLCIVCVCVCKCVVYYCHRVATQLQLTNISY